MFSVAELIVTDYRHNETPRIAVYNRQEETSRRFFRDTYRP